MILFPADSVALPRDSSAVVRDYAVPAADSVVFSRDSVLRTSDSIAFSRDPLPSAADSVAFSSDTVLYVVDSVAAPRNAAVRYAPIPVERFLERADSLRKAYEFRKAVSVCKEALSAAAPEDSLKVPVIENLLRQCENGAGMSDFVYEPQVVDSKVVAKEDFVLWYPFGDGAWHPLSCASDSLAAGPYPLKAMLPDSSYAVISSPLPSDRALCAALEQSDSLMLPDSVRVLPLLSQDGKTLYFSSDGLYGMGGYDLYKSELDVSSGEWGTPVNLGFPFSSPFNDYLLLNTDDGQHTIFASDRDCPADSVRIYVIDFDAMPVRKPLKSIETLREMMSLRKPVPQETASEEGHRESAVPENADTRRYMLKMQEVKALRDSIYASGKILDQERSRFAMSDDEEERLTLTGDILRREAALPVLQDSLSRAREELQRIEMEFLFNGIVVDMELEEQKPSPDGGKGTEGYPFSKRKYGETVIFSERSDMAPQDEKTSR
ncbi:MAG: hypothetical protein ACI395_03490 [Candidatus Cryptobacteroides sp.]